MVLGTQGAAASCIIDHVAPFRRDAELGDCTGLRYLRIVGAYRHRDHRPAAQQPAMDDQFSAEEFDTLVERMAHIQWKYEVFPLEEPSRLVSRPTATKTQSLERQVGSSGRSA